MNSVDKKDKQELKGWSQIARYLGRGVRTVQRWEQELQLPVRRSGLSKRRDVVTTTTSEIDRWVANTLAPIESRMAGAPESAEGDSSAKNITVLVVEDSVKDLSECVGLLKKLGVREVEAASSIASALSRLGQAKAGRLPVPGLIILDLLFATESGFEVLRYCKQHKELRAIPIVVWTAVDDARHEICEVFGVKSVVPKWAGTAELEAALKAVKASRARSV